MGRTRALLARIARPRRTAKRIAPSASARLPPDRGRQQDRDRERHHEPGRVPLVDQGGEPEGQDHPGRRHPVIAGDELPDADGWIPGSCVMPRPPDAAAPTRKRRTSPRENASTVGTITSRAASPPGHWAPPLGAPEDPKGREHHSHAELHRVLRGAGQRGADPDADRGDEEDGQGCGSRGQPDPVLVGPEGESDEDHLQALQENALEGDRERVAVQPVMGRSGRPRGRGLLPEDRLLVVLGQEYSS